jgi:hypothetical protein
MTENVTFILALHHNRYTCICFISEGIHTDRLTLWMLLIQVSIFSVDYLWYPVENYDKSSGIYFENKCTISLYSAEW